MQDIIRVLPEASCAASAVAVPGAGIAKCRQQSSCPLCRWLQSLVLPVLPVPLRPRLPVWNVTMTAFTLLHSF